MAILLHQPGREACLEVLDRSGKRHISAGTLTECYIVAEAKGVGGRMLTLIDMLEPTVLPVTAETAREALMAFRQWGKGRHPAGLNYGDCFSYVAAKQTRLPLLFTGNDFSQTDLVSAL